MNSVACRGIDHIHNNRSIGALQVGEVVVEELIAECFAVGSVEVVRSSLNGNQLTGGEDVVIVVHLRHNFCGNMQAGLGAVAARQVEVGMPSDAHGLRFLADIFRGNRGFNAVVLQGDDDGQVGFRKPVSAEIAGVDGTCNGGAIGADLNFVRLPSRISP